MRFLSSTSHGCSHYHLLLPIHPVAESVLSLAGLKPISSGQFLHPLTPCSRSMPGCTNPISLSELCFKIAKFNCFQGQLLSDLFPEICLSSFCSWRCLSTVAFVVFIAHLTFSYFLLCVVFQLFPVSVLHF